MPSWTVMGYLVLNGLIGTVLSDYLWMLSVLLTSPVVATLGLSLTIPGSMLADFVIHQSRFSWLYVLGSILVLMGFVVVNTDEYISRCLKYIWNKVRWALCPGKPIVVNGNSGEGGLAKSSVLVDDVNKTL